MATELILLVKFDGKVKSDRKMRPILSPIWQQELLSQSSNLALHALQNEQRREVQHRNCGDKIRVFWGLSDELRQSPQFLLAS